MAAARETFVAAPALQDSATLALSPAHQRLEARHSPTLPPHGVEQTTWLVSDGVPVNVVQQVVGHDQASTTLNRYPHTSDDYEQRVRTAFEGTAAFSLPPTSQLADTEEENRSLKPMAT